ncbi:CHAD domain-containing protein [Pleurocapsales cyanobacterium LEGE 06147]|nr:CHAD domain-containing protein [Pleurocapsales cyanobacterium LEGE 06147]
MSQQQEAKTFGDWAKIAIAKHFDKILKHENEVLQDKDPEELHQMRVGMRRLRSAMTGFAPAINLPKPAGEKQVGKVAKVLGKLRDLDVLQKSLKSENTALPARERGLQGAEVNSAHSPSPSSRPQRTQYEPNLPSAEQKSLATVLKFLKKQRKQAFKEVKTILYGDRYIRFKQELQDWLEQPSYQPIAALKIELVLPDLLLPQIGKLLLHPGWLVGVEIKEGEIEYFDGVDPQIVEQTLESRGEILHDLRKEAKRSRYNMALFTQFYGEAYQDYLQQIKDIQEILGQIQDSFILVEFLESVLESDIHKQMPTLAEQLSKTRFQKWQEWEKLQRHFLNWEKRQDLRTIVQHPQ